MKLSGSILLGLMIILGRCTPNKISSEGLSSTDTLTIRTGTSFGMCVGYCVKDYVINGTVVSLTMTNRSRTQTSTKTCQTIGSQENWQLLKSLANPTEFGNQPERIGCPDCADGGAEYIELQTGDHLHRVTFEYGQTIPGFEPLVDALRKQRNAFEECP